MFVFNLKINKDSFLKTIIAICAIICMALMVVSVYKIYNLNKKSDQDECLPNNGVANISDKNYTNVLKMVNDDLNTYIGQKISYTGYVYRVSDIKEDEFILARDMVISNSPKQTVVVGFLCSCKDSKNFENGTWVTITGTIDKGHYVEEVPILKITEIKRTSKPENSEVPVPDDYYVPTAVIY